MTATEGVKKPRRFGITLNIILGATVKINYNIFLHFSHTFPKI